MSTVNEMNHFATARWRNEPTHGHIERDGNGGYIDGGVCMYRPNLT